MDQPEHTDVVVRGQPEFDISDLENPENSGLDSPGPDSPDPDTSDPDSSDPDSRGTGD